MYKSRGLPLTMDDRGDAPARVPQIMSAG